MDEILRCASVIGMMAHDPMSSLVFSEAASQASEQLSWRWAILHVQVFSGCQMTENPDCQWQLEWYKTSVDLINGIWLDINWGMTFKCSLNKNRWKSEIVHPSERKHPFPGPKVSLPPEVWARLNGSQISRAGSLFDYETLDWKLLEGWSKSLLNHLYSFVWYSKVFLGEANCQFVGVRTNSQHRYELFWRSPCSRGQNYQLHWPILWRSPHALGSQALMSPRQQLGAGDTTLSFACNLEDHTWGPWLFGLLRNIAFLNRTSW